MSALPLWVKRVVLSCGLLSLVSLAPLALADPAARLGPVSILGSESNQLVLGLGAFNFNLRGPARYDARAAEAVGEFRLGAKWHGIGPMAGMMVNTRGGLMGYGGFYTSFRYHHLVITPELALGGYERGSGKYLGGTFQFREEISADWQFHNGQRLGVRFAHISNASVHARNPSEQELLLVYVLPLP